MRLTEENASIKSAHLIRHSLKDTFTQVRSCWQTFQIGIMSEAYFLFTQLGKPWPRRFPTQKIGSTKKRRREKNPIIISLNFRCKVAFFYKVNGTCRFVIHSKHLFCFHRISCKILSVCVWVCVFMRINFSFIKNLLIPFCYMKTLNICVAVAPHLGLSETDLFIIRSK